LRPAKRPVPLVLTWSNIQIASGKKAGFAVTDTSTQSFDIVIIGGGPGGYGAALYASGLGMNVAIIEKDKVGGTCLHRGCIPAKEFLETAAVYRHVSGAKDFGIDTSQPTVNFSVSQARKQRIVDQLWKGLQGLLKQRKITTFAGTGQLLAGKSVKITAADGTSSTIAGNAIILAAGSLPRVIPGFEPNAPTVMTSDEVLMLNELPQRVAVIGGGAIGCEFASTMADLGSQVTILEGLPKILPGCDTDVAEVVVKHFAKRGITIKTGVQVTGHTPQSGGGTVISLGNGETLAVDAVVVSVGRVPNSRDLVAPGTNVSISDRGFVEIDVNTMRTSEQGVWAIGDLVNTPQLAHVGFAEAIVAVKDIRGEHAVPVDYDKVPWCIYCHPEVAFAGLSEQAARERGIDVVVEKHKFIGDARALILGEPEGLVKIIAERNPATGHGGKILGVHMVGPWVTEQLGQGYLAVNWEATVDEVAHYIQPHPTLSETFGEAVMALTGRGLHG